MKSGFIQYTTWPLLCLVFLTPSLQTRAAEKTPSVEECIEHLRAAMGEMEKGSPEWDRALRQLVVGTDILPNVQPKMDWRAFMMARALLTLGARHSDETYVTLRQFHRRMGALGFNPPKESELESWIMSETTGEGHLIVIGPGDVFDYALTAWGELTYQHTLSFYNEVKKTAIDSRGGSKLRTIRQLPKEWQWNTFPTLGPASAVLLANLHHSEWDNLSELAIDIATADLPVLNSMENVEKLVDGLLQVGPPIIEKREAKTNVQIRSTKSGEQLLAHLIRFVEGVQNAKYQTKKKKQ